MSARCRLCGDAFHADPDTEGWMGLVCPGDSATAYEADAFLSRLTEAYATHIAAEFSVLHAEIAERRRRWYERTRTEVTPERLQADCDERTDVELSRQRREEVFQSYGDLEIDFPHLTVPGKAPPRPPLVRSGRDKTESEDALLYLGEDRQEEGS